MSQHGRHTRGTVARPAGRRAVLVVAAVLAVGAVVWASLALVGDGTTTPRAIPAAVTAAPATAPVAPAPPAPGPRVLTPAERARCPVTAVACVDLTGRTAWLQRGDRVVAGPVPMLPGSDTGIRPNVGDSTATPAGNFRVGSKDADHVSGENGEPMNHTVFFAPGGIAFHEGSLTETSNGCIHLSPTDAKTWFDQLRRGDGVSVF